MSAKPRPLVILRPVKRVAAGHHGGAWKVAYADFVTAMMAFFLVMWLVGIADKQQRAAISEYFKNPSAVVGKSLKPAPGANGPGGAADRLIPTTSVVAVAGGHGAEFGAREPMKLTPQQAKAAARAEEQRRLDALKRALEEAVERSQALAPFKDQLMIDLTPEGLRIQIVDRQNRPMFDTASARLKDYAHTLLGEMGGLLNDGHHRIALSGHTDEVPFHRIGGYGNWELSAERANAARRALVEGGLEEGRISRVVGLAASVPFDKTQPNAPINRRISIVVLNPEAENVPPADSLPGTGAPAPGALPQVAPISVAQASASEVHGSG
ncbi:MULTISPECIES: flagellar motor protein MotB [unclassified Lysobacter]|uniref:flagellar motor protein MotB n=1 Tax=unclassified Lysobacter TaxID=2635362 RepID=UPI001C226AC2|nr:flagellar motor protein MotB [Lysobacter sp. MMG2]MBU8975819.1 flagellar motor protein MotB [Lysobacter sp. MMG2]